MSKETGEPDWEQFRIDPLFDPPGVRMQKQEAFMGAFLDWRQSIHEKKSSTPRGRGKRSKATA